MKTALLLTGSGPLVIATSHTSLTDSGLLEKLRAKGIDKFIAYELPLDLVKKRYGGHFDIAMQDLNESDDLRVVDFSGERAFRLFHLKELGTPVLYESSARNEESSAGLPGHSIEEGSPGAGSRKLLVSSRACPPSAVSTSARSVSGVSTSIRCG
jgi:hypothetical protein